MKGVWKKDGATPVAAGSVVVWLSPETSEGEDGVRTD